jgi:hypothetical protein
LYWFRTPPGVRVGRAAIDDEAMRLLEQHNPDVQFDWPRLLKEQPSEMAAPRREREGREGREGRDRRDRRDARPAPRPRAMETSGAAVPPMLSPEAAEEIQAIAEAADARATEHAEALSAEFADTTERTDAMEFADSTDRTDATEFADSTERTDATEFTDTTEWTAATEFTDTTERTAAADKTERTEVTDNRDRTEATDGWATREPVNREPANREPPNREPPNREPPNREPPNREPPNREPPNREPANREPANREPANREPANREPANLPAAAARLGAEGVAQLRARYLDIVARLDEKPLEEPHRAELKAAAERLNPDTWRTADEVALALEQYETVFESLRAVVGRHPRRRV